MSGTVTTVRRGATPQFSTNFYDFNDDLIQPQAAVVNVIYPTLAGPMAQMPVNMTAGSGSEPWTAQLDTRGMGLGPVYWSIHSVPPIPASVEEGQFLLVGNPANLPTF